MVSVSPRNFLCTDWRVCVFPIILIPLSASGEKHKLHLVQQELAAERKKSKEAEQKILDLQRHSEQLDYVLQLKKLRDELKKDMEKAKKDKLRKIAKGVEMGSNVATVGLGVAEVISSFG